MQGEWEVWQEQEKTSPGSQIERLKKVRELNKKQIQAYIPSMLPEAIEDLSEGEISLVMKAIMEAAELNFGAKLDRDEKK